MSYKLEPEDIGVNTAKELSLTEIVERAIKVNQGRRNVLKSGAGLAARPGYPSVIVPFARVPNAPTPPFPDGFDAQPVPFGVMFTGLACAEPRLVGLAYAFEQATKRRVPPPAFP